jgi:hypothetical protein
MRECICGPLTSMLDVTGQQQTTTQTGRLEIQYMLPSTTTTTATEGGGGPLPPDDVHK